MKSHNAIYNDMQLSTEIETASPHRQIQLLLEKSLYHMNQAVVALSDKNIINKCNSISKALDIIIYLKNCLDLTTPDTKVLAQNLHRVYEYSEKKLVEANIHNRAEYINEVQELLRIIKSSWDSIA